jgi:HK97 family phage major capsid protein
MRRDEEVKLREQRNELVQELRSTSTAADSFMQDNKLSEWRAEDKEKWEQIEKAIIGVNNRLEMQTRTENLAAWHPEDAVVKNSDGAPKTLNEYRSIQQGRRIADEPEVRMAVYKWIVDGKKSLEAEEYRVLSKAANGGGFFVPTDLADTIVRALRFLPGGVGALARTLSTSTGDTFNIPLNLTHGSAAWLAESAAYTPSDEVITQGSLAAYKAGAKLIVSEELLTDSDFDLSGFIGQEFGERIGALAEAAYITGDGTGKPTGITDAASAVSASVLPAGQVTTTTYAGIAPAILSVPAQYRDGAALLVSDSLYVRLATIVDTTGRPIWSPSMAAGTPDTVLGMPVYSHPNLAAIGANSKSGIVGNFNRAYWIRRVNGIYMQRQDELHSDNGQVGFRAYLRLDGKVVLADALRIVTFAAT